MLAAIRKLFRPPATLTRQRHQGRDAANQDDPDLEASVGDTGGQSPTDDNNQQQQAGDDELQHNGRLKGHKNSRWQKANFYGRRDRRPAATNKDRAPACGGLGDSSSDSSGSGSSSSSGSSSDTTTSSSSSSSSGGSHISGNSSANFNAIQNEAKLPYHATAAAPTGEGQPDSSVAECGDCLQQHHYQQQAGHHDESDNPSCEQPQAQPRAHKARGGKDFNVDYDEEEDNEVDNEEDDGSYTAEDQNRVAFIAEVGKANTNRQQQHHSHVATSPASGVATPTTMPSSTSGAPFQASVISTPGTTVSTSRKTDVDQLLTGATSVLNQRRDAVRGNLEELRVAESVNYRPVVYKYSFKIPDTPANMRVFTDPDDRRIEAIARSCDSQIHLEKLPTRAAGVGIQGTLKMRKITIQSPDLHSLEKCCRHFDDRFKHFYVSGGLGLSGKSIQRVYVDELDN